MEKESKSKLKANTKYHSYKEKKDSKTNKEAINHVSQQKRSSNVDESHHMTKYKLHYNSEHNKKG